MNLKVIKTETENDAALERLGELMAANPANGTPELDEMLALGALIRQFEGARYTFAKPAPSPASVSAWNNLNPSGKPSEEPRP